MINIGRWKLRIVSGFTIGQFRNFVSMSILLRSARTIELKEREYPAMPRPN